MKLKKVELIIYYSLLCCAIFLGLSNRQANAENGAENNAESTPVEDTAKFHNQNQERRQVTLLLICFLRANGDIKLPYVSVAIAIESR